MISLATSTITQQVRDNIHVCLCQNRIGGGRFVAEFEDKVKKFTGAKYAVAVNNGSMADLVAIASLKVLNPTKTEVIVPALTFTAQVAAVIHNGLKPVFVDVNPPDSEFGYQMDATKVEKLINENTLCIMAVHLLGKECDIKSLKDIADRNNISIMEDCCEAYGGQYKDGGYFGTGTDAGTFSFFPSHTITTGEGGMIITNNEQVYDLAVKLRNHGRLSDKITEKFHFSHIGFNGKMSNLLASIGCGIADTAVDVIEQRKKNVKVLNKHLKQDWFASSPHCYPLNYKYPEKRDEKLHELEDKGIESRKLFSSLPTQEEAYKYLGYELGDFPVAESIGDCGLFVPVHQNLSEEDLEKICDLV